MKYLWLFQLFTKYLRSDKKKWDINDHSSNAQNAYVLSKQSKILANISEMRKNLLPVKTNKQDLSKYSSNAQDTYILSKQSKSSNMLESYLPTTIEHF